MYFGYNLNALYGVNFVIIAHWMSAKRQGTGGQTESGQGLLIVPTKTRP